MSQPNQSASDIDEDMSVLEPCEIEEPFNEDDHISGWKRYLKYWIGGYD